MNDVKIETIMSTQVVSVNKNTTLTEIKQLFAKNQLHHFPVLENNNLVGIITSSDVHAAELINTKIEPNFNTDKILAEEIMQNKVVSISSNATIKDAAKYLLEHKIHSLPVINASKQLVGIVTTYDLIKYIAKQS